MFNRLIFRCTCVLLFCAAALNAQFVRGTILGVVSDESGAVVPAAAVILKNTGTNETKSTTTDADGNYSFPALLPGLYSIQITHAGFQSRVVSEIKLEVNT